MAATILTDTAIRKAKPAAHVTRLRDANVKGLHLVISPNGSKAWAISYTSPETGKRRSFTLGVYKSADAKSQDKPEMSLEDARDAARVVRSHIRQGSDPAIAKARQKAKEVALESGSFDNLLDLYVAFMKAEKRATVAQVEGSFGRHIDAVTKALPASAITRHHVMELMEGVTRRAKADRGMSGERTADLLRSYISAAYEFAIRAQTSPKWAKKAKAFELLENNPAMRVGKYQPRINVGERTLSGEEVKRLWNEVGVEAMSLDMAIYLKLALSLGGQRVLELLQATWEEFNLEGRVWAIPMSRRKLRHKATHREPHLVYLTDQSIDLLTELHQLSDESRYLFPKRDGKAPRTPMSVNQSIKRYCYPVGASKRKPFEPFTARDLRRTAKTLMGEAGLSKDIRDRIQGHAFGDVASRHYDRHDYWKDKQRAMQRWSRWLDTLVTGKAAKVVSIR